MNKEDIQFKIDQLRKDKMIYALESIALSVLGILLVFLLGFSSSVNPLIGILVVSFVVLGYWVYMSIGNLNRLRKIKELEKKLDKIK